MNKQYDFIVIGKGLAAQCFLFELSKEDENYSILQISDEESHPACTFKTTSVVCLNGVKSDVTPLGDVLLESYEKTVEFIKKYKPDGIYSGSKFSLCEQSDYGKSEFIRRFGDVHQYSEFANMVHLKDRSYWGRRWECFLIEPEELMNWLGKNIDKSLDVTSLKGEVIDFDYNGHIVLSNDDSYIAKNIIICAGAYSKHFFEEKISDDILIKSKVVPGKYITFENIDWGHENVVIQSKKSNLIYRAYSNQVMIGGTVIKNEKDLDNEELLKEQYDHLASLLGPELTLPEYNSGKIKLGLRHKGEKRRPFWGAIDKSLWQEAKIFGIFGMYKSGFSFPFFAAQEVVKEL
jgi:hypothetical protein